MGIASAQNLVTAQAYWEDKTGQADFAQARTQAYTPYDGVLSRGFTASATWLRVRIQHVPASEPVQHIVLRVQPNYLDDVRLFDPLDPRDTPRVVGDRSFYAEQEYKSLFFGFVLPASTQDRDVWLRLKTSSSSKIGVDAFDEVQIRSVEGRTLAFGVMSLSLTAFYMLFVFISWIFDRERMHLIYLLRTGFLALTISLEFGFARVLLASFFPPNLLDFAFNFFLINLVLFGFIFEIGILREYGLKRWVKYACWGIYGGCSASLLVLVAGATQLALLLNATLVILVGLVLLCTSILGLKDSYATTRDTVIHLHRHWLSFYYFCLFLLLVSLQALTFGLFPLKVSLTMVMFALSAMPYALFSSTMLMLIILFRAREIRRGLQLAQLNLSLSMEREQSDHLRRREQSDLMNMLMHEIRNPLAVIEATQHTERDKNTVLVRKHIDAIRHLLDRMLKIDQLSGEEFHIQPQTFLFSDCLAQVMDDLHIDPQHLVLTGLSEDQFVHTDQDCLRVILGNLLGNAFKYGLSEASVELTVMHEADGFGMTVANRVGPGSVPDPTQVFDKYYRSEGAKKLPGTGMGLYLVQQLALRLGGECGCHVDGEHIRFEVWLPRVEDKSSISAMV